MTRKRDRTLIHNLTYLKQSVEPSLLKIFKGTTHDLSVDNSAIHPNFESHLLLLDKGTEFPINCHCNV